MVEEGKVLIQIHEHESLGEDISLKLHEAGFVPSSGGFMGIPKALGIQYGESRQLRASYYVGACHLPGQLGQLVVLPKIRNLDFPKMLAVCASYMPSIEYFSKCYGINISEKPIENADSYDILTPLISLHYIFILEKLVKRGLAKDYVTIQDNLNSRVKGRIDIFHNWNHNIVNSRNERVFCRFQVYTDDIAVNRLLKKAFQIARGSLHRIFKASSNHSAQYRNAVKNIADCFIGVNDVSHVQMSIPKRRNKLNPYYSDALELAKEIIRQQEANIKQGQYHRRSVRPFWIDFSRLFEVYVLALLHDEYGDMIEFQVKGNRAVADYVHRSEHIILDAKYKEKYLADNYEIDDIREISGNSRDSKICSRFIDWQGDEPECIIIYPDEDGIKTFDGPLLSSKYMKDIRQFRKFHKIGISLPMLV